MKTKYCLVSLGYRILSCVMLIFIICLATIVIYYNELQNIAVDVFILFLFLFFGYGFFVSHYARIIIINNKISFYIFSWFKPCKYTYSFDDIITLSLDNKIEEINVISLVTIKKTIKFTGYNSLKGYQTNLFKSKIIVSKINEELIKNKNISKDSSE